MFGSLRAKQIFCRVPIVFSLRTGAFRLPDLVSLSQRNIPSNQLLDEAIQISHHEVDHLQADGHLGG